MSVAPPAASLATSDERALIRQIALLSVAAFASSGAARITDPLLPQLADAFAVSAGQAAYAVSGFALAYGLLQLLYGPLGDRFGKYRVISYAMLASMAGALGTAMAESFSMLLFFRVLNGATAAAAIPLSMAWIADNVPYERRQPVLAYFLIGQIFGIISGQLFGGLFADLTGWRGAFWFMLLAFGVVGTLLVAELRRSPAIDSAAHGPHTGLSFLQRFKAVLTSRWARIILVGVCLEGACVFGGLAYVPTYLHTHFGISLTLAGGLMAVFGVAVRQALRRPARRTRSRSCRRFFTQCRLSVLHPRAALALGRARRLLCRYWLLHAAQHLSDQCHADGAGPPRYRSRTLCLAVFLRAVRRRLAECAGDRPHRFHLGLRHSGRRPAVDRGHVCATAGAQVCPHLSRPQRDILSARWTECRGQFVPSADE
jgi:predicted MFS family arabinose efflux permease